MALLKNRQTRLSQCIGRGLSVAVACTLAASAWAQTGNPRVNQVGYLPNGAKMATYASDSTVGLAWRLYHNGDLVAQGNTVPVGVDPASGENIHTMGFPEVTEEGDGYVLWVEGDESYPFSISSTAFTAPLYDSLKYFYHNRSGIEIEYQYTGGGNTSYAPDAQWARPAGHLNQGPNQGDYDVPCWEGTCDYSLDVTKGWYDAGDHGKYVVNGGISVWKLLNMYERALHLSGTADRFGDGTLNIPESGNGVPDILDEVRWQMEFMMAMQVPEGEAKAGMAHHKMHNTSWTGLPLAPHEDSFPRALVPPTTTATLNLAATAAQCARLWADIDAEFSQQCLTAAERAWEAAQDNPNDIYSGDYNSGGGGYGDADPSDEFYWAASELYITTGDSRYLPTIESFEFERTDWAWPDTELAGLMSLAVVPTSHTQNLRAEAQQQVIELADFHVDTVHSTGYRVPHTEEEYYWGSNNVLANKLFLVGLAHDFTDEDVYANAFAFGVDYLFGRNPMSFSYVSGHGEDALTQPHHRFWAGAVDANYPWLPPGVLSGGPNDGLEDDLSRASLDGCQSAPATCYIDHIDAWSTNEITINWNSALAWVLAFYDDYAESGDSSGSSSSAVSSSSSPSSSASPSSSSSSLSSSEASVPASSASSSSSLATSSASSSLITSSSSASGGEQCNWYGTTYPLCESTQSGWGWENNQSCIASSTCSGQPAPYGIVGGGESSAGESSSSEEGNSSEAASSSSVSEGGGLASCEYVISNEWNDGYTGAVRISNTGNQSINGWSVSWEYSDGSSVTNSWNAQFSGSNPYTASDMGWNGSVQPGQSVEFGFQVSKGSGSAQVPQITGDICD